MPLFAMPLSARPTLTPCRQRHSPRYFICPPRRADAGFFIFHTRFLAIFATPDYFQPPFRHFRHFHFLSFSRY
jgi:hypothetical protein